MYGNLKTLLEKELSNIKSEGLYKKERIITTPQGANIKVSTGENVLNFCANNYLGLSSHPEVIQAAKDTLDSHGYGMSSVRFICGTQDIHKNLENKISDFLQVEDTILYAAAFDANGGVFEPLFDNSFSNRVLRFPYINCFLDCQKYTNKKGGKASFFICVFLAI